MRNRVLCWAILAFQAFWLNVVIPGHQRGVVQLPGHIEVVSCPLCAAAADATPVSSHQNSPRTSGGCAICFFAAHLSVAPAIDTSPGPLRFLHELSIPSAFEPALQLPQIPFDTRGPPEQA